MYYDRNTLAVLTMRGKIKIVTFPHRSDRELKHDPMRKLNEEITEDKRHSSCNVQ